MRKRGRSFESIARSLKVTVPEARKLWQDAIREREDWVRQNALQLRVDELDAIDHEIEELLDKYRTAMDENKLTSATRLYQLVLQARRRREELLVAIYEGEHIRRHYEISQEEME